MLYYWIPLNRSKGYQSSRVKLLVPVMLQFGFRDLTYLQKNLYHMNLSIIRLYTLLYCRAKCMCSIKCILEDNLFNGTRLISK